MWTSAFWKGAGERGIKTFAQSLLAGFVVTLPIVEQPWLPALGVAATATVLSLLTSIGNASFTAGEEPAAADRGE